MAPQQQGKRQARRPSGSRGLCQFYLTREQRDAVTQVCGDLSFSAFVAAAVLREATRRGAIFYGDTRGGACARAAPRRGAQRCASGDVAVWLNRLTRAWVCTPCAAQANELEPGTCLSPKEQRAQRAVSEGTGR